METPISKFNILYKDSEVRLTWQENCQQIKKYADGKAYIQYTRIHCTVCNCHLGSAAASFKDIFIHPLLKVLICRDCFEFYEGGDFVQGDDGNESYCRWCGQGGTLVCCTKCPKVFCKTCVRNNFNKAKFMEITSNDNWKCFSCDFTQISALRIHCYEFRAYCITQENDLSKENTNPFSKLLDYSTCCVSRQKSPRKRRSEESNIHESKLLKVSKSSCSMSKSSSKLHDGKPRSTVRKLYLNDGKYKGTDDNVNNNSTFVPKPFAFVSLPSFLEQTNLHSDSLPINPPSNSSLVPIRSKMSSELLHGQHFFYRPGFQTSCQIKVVNAKEFLENRMKEIDRAIRETALVNSTFASAILQLTQMNTSAECLNEHITIYNSLQECLNTSIGSLEQIQKQLSIVGATEKRN